MMAVQSQHPFLVDFETTNIFFYDEIENSSGSLMLDVTGNSSGNTAAHRFVFFAESVIQPCILGFGILTNIVSLLVLQKVKINYIFRTCLIALAMSDLATCVCGFIALILEVTLFDGEMPFGNWHPMAVLTYGFFYSYMMFICCSATIVILIAFIRNMFIMAPMKAGRYFTATKTKFSCCLSLAVTVLIFAPTSLNIIHQSCFDETEAEICTRVNRTIPKLEKIATKYLFAITTLYGPIVILAYTICFICIRVTVGRSVQALSSMTMKSKDSSGRDSTRKRTKAASRVTRTLLIILLLDVVCTLPTVIQGAGLILAPKATVFDKTNVKYDIFDVIAEIFLNLRPTYNFWLYMFHHPEFRMRLKQIVKSRTMARRPSAMDRSNSSSDYRTENTFVSRETPLTKARRSLGQLYDRSISTISRM